VQGAAALLHVIVTSTSACGHIARRWASIRTCWPDTSITNRSADGGAYVAGADAAAARTSARRSSGRQAVPSARCCWQQSSPEATLSLFKTLVLRLSGAKARSCPTDGVVAPERALQVSGPWAHSMVADTRSTLSQNFFVFDLVFPASVHKPCGIIADGLAVVFSLVLPFCRHSDCIGSLYQ
jgi:hypothetical protein